MSRYNFPMQFQGNKKKRQYFEGWYYKFVTADQRTSIAFIPGISLAKEKSHAFIQVFVTRTDASNKKEMQTEYIAYQVNDFQYDTANHRTKIDKSLFGLNDIALQIESEKLKVFGNVELKGKQDISRSFITPSIMGFFRYIPGMECYHGVVSMSHYLKGTITLNDEKICLDGGKGYIEKDWGKSFPKQYIWMQTNHFKDETTSLMLSYATIPFLGIHFNGYIASLIYQGKEYRFATYNRSKIKVLEWNDSEVKIVIKKGKFRLEVIAKNQETTQLPSPNKGLMNQTIKEGLSGEIKIALYERETLIFKDIGTNAGLEIMMEEA